MKRKEYIPIVYIIYYNILKSNSVNGRVSFPIPSVANIRIRKSYERLIFAEMNRLGLIKYKFGSNYIEIGDSKLDKLLQDTSKMYRYVCNY